ncbi:MAG: MerR family transcriptional regulator [Actinomycetota bacterium]
MRIDELAKRAGVPARTIRYYTQQELLDPPTLRGRVGYYDDAHLDRLRLIKELQEKRFLPLSVIRSVIRHLHTGANLDTMLAPLDIVFRPQWDDERDEYTRDELATAAGVDEDVLQAAEDMGFLFPKGRGRDRTYTADDVHMLGVAKQWVDLAIPRNLGKLYRESLEEISQLQVRAFNSSIVAPLSRELLSPEVARERLIEGYQAMASVFEQLVALLHRKVLQKAVESFAAEDQDNDEAAI